MIICICNRISDRQIKEAIEKGVQTFDELRKELPVSTNCGKCRSTVEDILTGYRPTARNLPE